MGDARVASGQKLLRLGTMWTWMGYHGVVLARAHMLFTLCCHNRLRRRLQRMARHWRKCTLFLAAMLSKQDSGMHA